MSDYRSVAEPELERQGKRFARPGLWLIGIAFLVAFPGALLIVFTNGWVQTLGIVLVALAGPPAVAGTALFLSSLVARWAARHRSFA